MITIAELFPLYSTGYKWISVFQKISALEEVRLEKEYIIHTITKEREEYTIDGKFHNPNGPASIGFYENGNVWYQSWYKDDKFHNFNGPASIGFYENGNVSFQEWYKNDKLHNSNGPARIGFYENGNVRYQSWYQNGKHHHSNL